jgi:hypothetical protein
MIIGLNGKMGSGKDLVAKIIQTLVWLNSKPSNNMLEENKLQIPIEEFVKSNLIFVPEGWRGFCNVGKESSWQVKKFAYAVKQICSILTGIPVEDFEKEEVKNSFLGEEWSRYHGFVMGENTFTKLTVRNLLQKVGTDAMRNIVHEDCWVNALMKDYQSYYTEKARHDPFGDYHCVCKNCGVKFGSYNKHQTLCENCYGSAVPKWLISDVRFPNEYKAIKDRNGIVIRVNRPLYKYTYDCQTVGLKTVWLHHWVSTEDSGNFMSFNSEVYSKEDSYKELMKVHNEEFPQHESETALDDYEFDYIMDNSGTVVELIIEVEKMLKYFKIL